MAAGTAAAMVLLPGAASAQVVHSVQKIVGTTADPAVPSPGAPGAPSTPQITEPGGGAVGGGAGSTPGGGNLVPDVGNIGGLAGRDSGLLGGDRRDGRDGDHHDRDRRDGDHRDGDHRDGDGDHHDSSGSHEIDDPEPPDHASGAVARIDLLRSHLLDITRYNGTIEDNGDAHSDSTVLGLGGSRIIGSSASSRDHNREGDNGDALKLCSATSGVLCLSLLYHNAVATEDHDSSLAAARGGVAALCLGGRDKETTASYECNGILSLGVAEGLGIAERDKEHGHTKADSANELLNLCLGKRDKLTTPCEGLGVQAVHADSKSRSDKPDTERHSFLLGIDSNGHSSYLGDQDMDQAFPKDCGDSALLCLLLNQGRSVIFHNPKGAGSAVEALRLDVLNRTLLVVLGQAETLAHETNDNDHHNKGEDNGNKGEDHGNGENNGKGEAGPELAQTGADVAGLLAGGFLLTGLGALTVAATRRRVGKHSSI
ncbi:MAG: hypothetical protein DLM60_18735 [Pseudonocardiales bacterium]|nr:MAG: hypothetical protein DLM60_18735 [Pseudonocardiales bacterium]